jgi:hypothetical protein
VAWTRKRDEVGLPGWILTLFLAPFLPTEDINRTTPSQGALFFPSRRPLVAQREPRTVEILVLRDTGPSRYWPFEILAVASRDATAPGAVKPLAQAAVFAPG